MVRAFCVVSQRAAHCLAPDSEYIETPPKPRSGGKQTGPLRVYNQAAYTAKARTSPRHVLGDLTG